MSLLDADAWASRSYYGGDLPAEAERALHEAGLAWDDPERVDAHLAAAMAMAPGHLAVHLAHYKALFYRQRWSEASAHALAIVALLGRELGLSQDWRRIRPGDADFTTGTPRARLFLFALAAYGYVLVRHGDIPEGRTALRQADLLDPSGQTGAHRILHTLDRGPDEEDDDDAADGPGDLQDL